MKQLVLFATLLFASVFLSACDPLTKKAKSGLQVQITDTTAASVYLNDNYVEKTPFISRELNPGEYTLKIQPDDPTLIPYETKITLRAGLLTVVTWQLASRPELSGGVMYEMEPINLKNKSEISFATIPDGAIITVAGTEKIFSPALIPDVTPGHIEFEVTLPSYGTQKHTINAIPGYRMLVTVKLAKENLNAPTTQPEQTQQESQATQEAVAATPTPPASSEPIPATTSATPTGPTNAGQQVIINSTNFYVDGSEVLRVRDLPSPSGKEVGFAKVGSVYPYLEKTENNFLNIQFDGISGWVSSQYAQLVQ